ncbi:unnamed protein product [Durusdinium trenchii]|uniref:Uncharacterized protein n=1 Tax=Durusdinium trenchii TaxID=1381693 RepID=A0ABP0ICL7_9DINO
MSEMSDISAPLSLTLVTGPKLNFGSSEGQRCLEPKLAFSVDPLLPRGLTLNAKTGTIIGVPIPKDPSSKARWHIITVTAPAKGYGGIDIGDVPLTRCVISLTVLPENSSCEQPIPKFCHEKGALTPSPNCAN